MTYAPHLWDYVDRFAKWHEKPFIKSNALSSGLSTIIGHREKFLTLAKRATLLIPELEKEREELKTQGYSNGDMNREFTGIVETLICELYACLDGLKKTIYAIYRDVQGVQSKSTQKLFQNAAENKYGSEFPTEISTLLKTAYKSWFSTLRCLRTELTHGRIGSCSMQEEGQISYMHRGIRPNRNNNIFIIEDIVVWINNNASYVNNLLDRICMFWFSQLEPREVIEPCGIHQGRLLIRAITVTDPLDQDSGLCLFRHAFEAHPDWVCPLTGSCLAYKRVGNHSQETLERLTSKA